KRISREGIKNGLGSGCLNWIEIKIGILIKKLENIGLMKIFKEVDCSVFLCSNGVKVCVICGVIRCGYLMRKNKINGG
ncbi:hypothetical protein, partial [Staphylococcus epidermidis]|uniref:hypothetical protein n=1 Tax=Staphylococcus epidermidis TaxID=1282 RepID=UPI001C92CBB0